MSPSDRVYLDYNATSPLRPEARAAVVRALDGPGGNPSSVHADGRAARRVLEEARRAVAAAVGARPAEVVFTASATEANNLALKGVALGGALGEAGRARRRLVTTSVEHPSVQAPAAWLAGGGRGFEHVEVGVDGAGRLSLAALAEAVDGRTLLVSVIAAHHETGVRSPVAEAAQIARRAGALLHVDATQALGRVPVDVAAWGADLLTVSSHKVGGPRGAAALVVRPGARPEALLHGGPQERARRGGTEDVAAAAGFAAACEAATRDLAGEGARLAALRDALWSGVRAAVPDAVRLGDPAVTLPNTLCVAFPGADGEALLFGLDLAGVSASLGSACASGSLAPSRALTAMGVTDDLARAAVRFSLGFASSAADVERALAVLPGVIARAREGVAA